MVKRKGEIVGKEKPLKHKMLIEKNKIKGNAPLKNNNNVIKYNNTVVQQKRQEYQYTDTIEYQRKV